MKVLIKRYCVLWIIRQVDRKRPSHYGSRSANLTTPIDPRKNLVVVDLLDSPRFETRCYSKISSCTRE